MNFRRLGTIRSLDESGAFGTSRVCLLLMVGEPGRKLVVDSRLVHAKRLCPACSDARLHGRAMTHPIGIDGSTRPHDAVALTGKQVRRFVKSGPK